MDIVGRAFSQSPLVFLLFALPSRTRIGIMQLMQDMIRRSWAGEKDYVHEVINGWPLAVACCSIYR